VPRAVAGALVVAHDAHWAEAHALVGPDRAHVGGGRVDRQAMVAADLKQPPRDCPDRVGAEAAILSAAREDDVDRGVAVLRLGLLVGLD
jgi:hypothetical protein